MAVKRGSCEKDKAMATEFKLPELGENIESGKVTSVMVAFTQSLSLRR